MSYSSPGEYPKVPRGQVGTECPLPPGQGVPLPSLSRSQSPRPDERGHLVPGLPSDGLLGSGLASSLEGP